MRSRTATTWFETVANFPKQMEDGSQKKVNETYVVDAMTCTEAESKVKEELLAYSAGELNVKSTKTASYSEIFFSDRENDDKWYKAKLVFITLDEKSQKEKRSSVVYLVQADNFTTALKNVKEVMSGTQIDYEITCLQETKIMDVFDETSK